MTHTANKIMKYIYDWLVGLGIGEVFQDRKPYDDTTKQRDKRCYIVFTFDNTLEDRDAFWTGTCAVIIGCRDKAHFVADMVTLDNATTKFLHEFDKNDTENGMHLFDVRQDYFDSDDMGNHEYQYSFDVIADYMPEEPEEASAGN